ncbi:MAG: hypothetical protein II825_08645 [Paludibacteraceae bacterium]|nr:hypothetical protein [Paludibacteraceae bacterium]
MKKILFFCAALVAAINANATITTMTCAEAKQYVQDHLQSGETATDSVSVTGYVTKDYSGISRGQQRFSMDDNKGTVETIHLYYANMPEGEAALNVGDKVTVKGLLQNYNGSAQMKNGDVAAIIERIQINIDTIESSVCEVIEEGESLNAGEKTTDYFIVEGIVSSIKSEMNQYNQESFWMVCDANEKELQAYNAVMKNGEAAQVGDKVKVIGRIENFNGTIELSAASAEVLEKGDVQIDTLRVTVAEAIAAGKVLERGKTSVNVYIVEGYNDSIAYTFSESSKNMSFYMCDDLANPSYEFEAYKAKTEVDIPVGTKVQIIGNLYHYYKAAIDEKPEIDIVEISEGQAIIVPQEGIDNINSGEKATKLIEAGQVVIIRNGVRYNALGVEVK